jgi:signal transduction histidine kinase
MTDWTIRHADVVELGIGLTVVKEILEAHDGNVVCKTNGGHGTRFEVRLPRNGSKESAA